MGLQLGHGMLDLSKNLISKWNGGLTVLSPRDLNDKQMKSLAKALINSGGEVAVDPQFYIPKTDHKKLKSHSHWPDTYDTMAFWTSTQVRELVEEIYKTNLSLRCSRMILPALMPNKVDAMWLSYQKQVIEAARKIAPTQKLILSVPLTADSVKDDAQIQAVLDFMSVNPVDGIYILCEHPGDSYFVDDPTWLKNVLELIAGSKLRGVEVIVGYCNSQSLMFACAGADFILTGNWMNVRMFNHKKFMESDSVKINRTPWFYFPNMLSEFKRATLDVAKNKSYLIKMKYPAAYFNPRGDKVFNPSIQPSQVFDFPDSFKHYLLSMNIQTSDARKTTYAETLAHHLKVIDDAEKEAGAAVANGINAESRSILPTVDAMRSALDVLNFRRGGQLRRNWSKF